MAHQGSVLWRRGRCCWWGRRDWLQVVRVPSWKLCHYSMACRGQLRGVWRT
ncbi:hypothetical protein ACS0TY_006787 [Phlomoides rotata]